MYSMSRRIEMTSRFPPEELLELEVGELTDLLRHEDSSGNIRRVLAAKGLDASRTILAGLIDGMDGSRYGVVLTPSRECVVFEMAPDDSLVRWEIIEEPDALTSGFQAVSAGISMVRSGQIS
jgi:hypothetical protein